MSNRIARWKLLGSVGVPLVALSLPLSVRFQRDIRSAYARVAALHSQVIETPAGRIEYATFGAGYPVLVVHGNCGGFDQGIASARPVLGEEFHAIVPSRFGYLRTPLPEHASPASQADAHACLLDYLGVDRAAVIAYSAGSTSAIQLALRHPARVSALVLSSPNGPGKEPMLPPQAVFNALFRSDFLFWLITTYFSAGVRVPMGIPKGLALTPAHQAEVAEVMRTVLPVKPRADGVLFDTYVSNPDINTGYPFGEIATPTLVVSARDDPMAPCENAHSLAEQIPGAELLALERGGHLMLGQRERTIPAIRRFLREHSSTQPSARVAPQPARLSVSAGETVTGEPVRQTGPSSDLVDRRMPTGLDVFTRATRPIRTVARAAVFFLKVFPMLPSRPVDWVTPPPLVEKVRYPACVGQAEGDIYRPSAAGPHPGIVVCLGVVPFGVDHPQVPVLGKALARAGFAALLYWSPAMRDFRLDPEDVEHIPAAYHWFIEQPYVDGARSGLLGTCVGGSFALMAAASPLIRDHVAFLAAYAPYCSMWTFARDIASATRSCGDGREPWQVDPLTRKVFVHSLTALLEPGEAERFRSAFATESGHFDGCSLSADGQAVYSLLTARDEADAETALHRLPPMMQARLAALSPMQYLKDIHAPLIVLLHDRGDPVIPVGESRQLRSALAGHAGVRYTEMQFHHLDPVKGKLPLSRLVRELGKFFRAVHPLFRQ